MPPIRTPPVPRPRRPFDALEADPEDLALALWQSLRIVIIWAYTPAPNRPGLFRPVHDNVRERHARAIDAAPSLADALCVFAGLQDAPEVAEAATVGKACNHVWEWADRRGVKSPTVRVLMLVSGAIGIRASEILREAEDF